MKHIDLFESFVEKIYEIGLSSHWQERTDIINPRLSRVVPRSRNHPYGWELINFLTNNNREITKEEFFFLVGAQENTIKTLIQSALFSLTRSNRLRDWFPENRNKTYQMMNLGRISIWDGQNYYYPRIQAGSTKGENYPIGDSVWGFTKEDLMGVTVKYYPSNKEGMEMAYGDSLRDSKLSSGDFYKLSEFSYPYGKNFEVVVDLSDTNIENIQRKISSQVEGLTWELGPEPERQGISVQRREPTRKTITPGMDLGLIVKFIDQKNPFPGVVRGIMNIKEIQNLQKFKSINELKEIKILFSVDPTLLTEEQREKLVKPDGSVTPVTITLTQGSLINIDGTAYTISKDKPLVTSEPSIINQGNVQIWVE